MERMLVVVFDNEPRAYEGRSALRRLALDGSVAILAEAVVVRHADGSASIKHVDEPGPLGTLAGTSVGSLIGLIGGPVGLAIGATSGMALGALFDIDNARVGEDFVSDVVRTLAPNKVALVAEIEEEWTTPVDTAMESLGGTVLRRALWEVEESIREEEIAAMKADVAQFKKEVSQANAERRTKLQSKVDQLQAKIEARQKKMKEWRDAFQARQAAKRDLLKKNAAAAGRAIKELAKTAL